jgi:hypothetical protein
MIGMENMVKRLLIDVRAIDRATFPLNRYVTKPEVVPPGHAARIIIPTLNVSGRFENNIMTKPNKGRIIICELSPMKKAFGKRMISLKLPIVSDKPRPNIMEAKTTFIR